MAAISNTTSLTLLIEEINVTLQQGEALLEAYLIEPNDKQQQQFVELLQQVRGVCAMVELPAATFITTEMVAVATQLHSIKNRERAAGALSRAIVLLRRYLEYVQQTNKVIPELLVEGINELRVARREARISESHFADISLQSDILTQSDAVVLDEHSINELKRLRHMYQVGLLAVLTGESAVGIKVMGRAVTQLVKLVGATPYGQLWWLASGVLQGFVREQLALSPTRKHLLANYDRSLRDLITQSHLLLSQPPDDALVKESLYLLSLCRAKSGIIADIQAAYAVEAYMSDAQLQAEISLMSGGSSNVIRAVAKALQEELQTLQSALDMAAQGAMEADFTDLANTMERMASTLVMVDKPAVAERLQARAQLTATWSMEDLHENEEQLQGLVDDLLLVENTIAELNSQQALTSSAAVEYNERVSRYRLDEARLAVIAECRSGLTLTKRSLTTYLENGNDRMHITNIPNVLASIVGGLSFLHFTRAQQIINLSMRFVQERLLAMDAEPATEAELDLLADAVSSVDYFLESMEEQKPIGEVVLEIAEKSLAALGYQLESVA